MYISAKLRGSLFTAKPIYCDDSELDEHGYIKWDLTCNELYNEWLVNHLEIPLFQSCEEGMYMYTPRHHKNVTMNGQFLCESDILKYYGIKVLYFDGTQYV